MTFIYNETGYDLGDGTVVTLKTYEKYFERFVKDYAGNKQAEFNKVDWESKYDQFIIEYSVPAESCGVCDYAGVTEGICDGYGEGHNEPHQAFINYKTLELYAWAQEGNQVKSFTVEWTVERYFRVDVQAENEEQAEVKFFAGEYDHEEIEVVGQEATEVVEITEAHE